MHPRAKKSAAARQLLAWFWVAAYRQRQSVLCRETRADSALVSRWYGRALERHDELEPWIDRIALLLPGRAEAKEGAAGASRDASDRKGSRVVYGVELSED